MICDLLRQYFIEREKIGDERTWIGKKTTDPFLRRLQQAIDAFYWPLSKLSQNFSYKWKIQIGFGKGNVAASQYVALLPPNQKVSDGIYFCICFDHCGLGCVMGAMTSVKKQPLTLKKTIIRGQQIGENENQPWQLFAPHKVDVQKWNNAFFLPWEITKKQMEEDSAAVDVLIEKHFAASCKMISEMLS